MPFKKANIDILTQIEYGGSYTMQTNLTGYKINGTDLFASAATTSSGFLYSDETYTPTGYKKNGTQIVLQKAGCRPRSATRLWASGGAGTAYIHRYSNGAVYVTATATHTENPSDTRLSWANDSPNYPRGVRYLIAHLCGGGGGGGAGGLVATYNNQGGQGAAGAVLIKLPENGYATLTVGAAGSNGNGIGANGTVGGASSIVCGGFTATANGGGKANGGGNSSSSGGTWSASANNTDGRTIAYSSGAGGNTDAKAIAYTDPTPEAGTYATRGGGGGGGAGKSGYKPGSAAGVGLVDLYY